MYSLLAIFRVGGRCFQVVYWTSAGEYYFAEEREGQVIRDAALLIGVIGSSILLLTNVPGAQKGATAGKPGGEVCFRWKKNFESKKA